MNSAKFFKDKFLAKAMLQRRRIGIAILRPIPETMESLNRAKEVADIIVVGAKVDGFENIIEPDLEKASGLLIGLLKDKKVDGIVRGQVKDSFTLDEFFRQFKMKPIVSNKKVAPGVLCREDTAFVCGTASVYFGMNLEDKIDEANRLIRYMKEDLGITPKIAVMSTRRPTSKVGKYKMLEDIAKDCEGLANHLRGQGHEVKEFYIEYESAVAWGANLIFPAVGLVGNAWFKALLYLGGWDLLCCPYLDLGVAYEDGSRNETKYYWHVVHCVAMVNGLLK